MSLFRSFPCFRFDLLFGSNFPAYNFKKSLPYAQTNRQNSALSYSKNFKFISNKFRFMHRDNIELMFIGGRTFTSQISSRHCNENIKSVVYFVMY